MSKYKDDGGSAFPIGLTQAGPCGGLTRRDWFKGRAITGIIANESLFLRMASRETDDSKAEDRAAALAGLVADAMIAEESTDAVPKVR